MIAHHAVVIKTLAPKTYTLTPEPNETWYELVVDKFGIDEARALKEEAYRRPNQGHDSKALCVKVEQITLEAQHALLKLLEEPPVSVRIIFVLPTSAVLLPTILSRVHLEEVATERSHQELDVFAALPYKERLLKIEQELASEGEWALRVKSDLTAWLYTRPSLTASSLATLEFVASTLLTRGASNKQLLETLALTLPLQKK